MAVECVDGGTASPDRMPSKEFLKQVNGSLEYYDALVQSDPDNAEAWCIREMCYNNRYNQYDEAVVNCEKALEPDPEYGMARYLSGIVLMNMNRHCEALPCFENATRYDPELALDAHNWYVYNEKICSQYVDIFLFRATPAHDTRLP